MGSGYSKMKKQARAMQSQMEQLRQNLQNTEVSAEAGNGLVTVTLDGEKNLKKIAIQKECVNPEDIEGLEDLILSAFQKAHKALEEKNPQMPF